MLHRSTVTPTKTLGDSSKSLVTVCTDNTTAVTTHTATPSGVANQGEPLTGDDLVAVVKTVVDRSVMKLSTLKQSLHLLHHKVDHSDLMEALQVADIIEIDCKVWATCNVYSNCNVHITLCVVGICLRITLAVSMFADTCHKIFKYTLNMYRALYTRVFELKNNNIMYILYTLHIAFIYCVF